MDVLRELAMSLGLDVDAASFAQGQLMADGLKGAFEGLKGAVESVFAAYKDTLRLTAEHAHETDQLAQRTGIATDTLQELSYAAGLNQVSMDELAVSLGHLARTGVKDLGEGLLQASDHLLTLQTAGERNAYAIEKFGRAGGRLLPFLMQGREGIAALAAEAKDLGVVMDKGALAKGEEYAIGQRRLNAALDGLRYTIAGPLFDGATKTALMFVRWTKTLRDFLKQSQVIRYTITAVTVAVGVLGTLLAGAALRAMVQWGAAQLAAAVGAETFGTASLLAGAKAAGAAFVAIAPWALLAGLLVLIADDIVTFLEGGDSLLGRYGEKFTHFLDAWTRPNPEDWWLLKALKAAIHALSDLQGTYEEFRKTFFGGAGGGIGSTTTYNAAGQPTGTLGAGKGGFMSYLADSFSGAPSVPASSAGGVTNSFSATVNVTGGSDPVATALATRNAMDQWWQVKVGDFAAGR